MDTDVVVGAGGGDGGDVVSDDDDPMEFASAMTGSCISSSCVVDVVMFVGDGIVDEVTGGIRRGGDDDNRNGGFPRAPRTNRKGRVRIGGSIMFQCCDTFDDDDDDDNAVAGASKDTREEEESKDDPAIGERTFVTFVVVVVVW